jgi:hypothetical protein
MEVGGGGAKEEASRGRGRSNSPPRRQPQAQVRTC